VSYWYVSRASPGGPVTGLFANLQPGTAEEYLPESHPDVQAFLTATRRRPRPLWSIRADIQALTAAQFSNVWADLSAAVPGEAPRKYLTDYGANVAGIFVFDWGLYVTGPTAAQVKAGQISLAAMYTQDNPKYLVNPPFDPSIDVPGDEPV
jgi:hypothetical protein